MAAQFKNVDDSGLLADINPTPLIDVLLVLLIVLIIALPLSTHRTSVDLQQGLGPTARPSVVVAIEFDGSLYWNGAPVADLSALERLIRVTAREVEQPNVVLEASPLVRYDVVAHVLAM